MCIHKLPSLFGTIMICDPQGEVLGWIIPFSNSFYNYFFTSFTSRTNYLYNQIFENGDSRNGCISCPTSLLGGIPLGSWKNPLYACRNPSNCFCYLVQPSRDAFIHINSSLDFLLELINFLAWLALASEILDFPLCTLIKKYFPSSMS